MALNGDEMLHFLKGVSLFADLNQSTLEVLSRAARQKQYPKHTYVFFQSDPADTAFIVRSGAISIALSSPDGRELVINEMHPGDCFGELGLITGERRSTSAVAQEKSEVIAFSKEVFLNALKSEPKMMLRLLKTTAQRLANSSERESALVFLDAESRLAGVLLNLDEIEEEKGYVQISQEELGTRTGLTRQTTAKILGRWRRAGWLITGRGRIMVIDRIALRRLRAIADH